MIQDVMLVLGVILVVVAATIVALPLGLFLSGAILIAYGLLAGAGEEKK